MTKPKEKPEIRCKVFLVLKEYDFKKHGNRHREQLRMVQWNDNEPTIERRQMIMSIEGEYRPRKARGLSQEDLKLIELHKDKIETVFKEFENGRKENSI